MPRPTTTPTWATDPNYPAGSDPWSGTPTRVEPDTGDQAQGLVPGTRPPAQWLNWLFGLFSDWVDYLGSFTSVEDELVYPAEKTRVLRFSSFVAHDAGEVSPPYTANAWIVAGGPGYVRQAAENGAVLVFPLSDLLPGNGTVVVTRCRALVKPAAARATASERMKIYLVESTPDWTAPIGTAISHTGELSVAQDDGTSNAQLIDTGVIAWPADRAIRHTTLQLRSGSTGAVADEVYGFEITFTQDRPGAY